MQGPSKELCVVHLVRAHNGIEPFRRFLKSYRQNQGGIEHDLLIIFKGFDNQQEMAEYYSLLTPFKYSLVEVSDAGFDVTAYLTAFRSYSSQYRYFCFLNSYSVIQDCDWLRKLHYCLAKKNVGLVGATASWESHRGKENWFNILLGAVKGQYKLYCEGGLYKFLSGISSVIQRTHYLLSFDITPNYHIRTNAFMISTELMQSLHFRPINTKEDAHRFESGKDGLSKQILNIGKNIIVVGRDGKGYEKEEWNISNTFRSSEQENLLVEDNQTEDYKNGSTERRNYLKSITWNI